MPRSHFLWATVLRPRCWITNSVYLPMPHDCGINFILARYSKFLRTRRLGDEERGKESDLIWKYRALSIRYNDSQQPLDSIRRCFSYRQVCFVVLWLKYRKNSSITTWKRSLKNNNSQNPKEACNQGWNNEMISFPLFVTKKQHFDSITAIFVSGMQYQYSNISKILVYNRRNGIKILTKIMKMTIPATAT